MTARSLTDALRETLDVFDAHGAPLTTNEVAERLDLGRRSTYERLDRLAERGGVETKKVGANGRVWWVPRPDAVEAGATGDDRRGQQFRSLVEATEEYAIFMLDPEGHVRTWNPGAERIEGYDAEEILGEHFSTFYTAADRAAGVPERNLAVAAAEGSVEDEGWRVRADGSRFWASVTITPIREDGDLAGYAKVTRDTTDRREYEQRLRDEKAFVESLLDSQHDVIYALDGDGSFLRWNERLVEVTGYSDTEIESMHALDVIAEDAADRVAEAIRRTLDGEHVTVEAPLETADGGTVPYEFSGTPLQGEKVAGLTGVGRDVRERKAKERRLERRHDELRAELDEVFERVDEAFFALDEEWRFSYVNERSAALLDRSVGELLGREFGEALPEMADSTFRDRYERAMETQETVTFEAYHAPLSSWFEVTAYPSESGLSVYFRDVTERKERERELERYETVTETIRDGVYVLDDQHRFRFVNGAMCELTGKDREELIGAHASTVTTERDIARVDRHSERLRESDESVTTVETELIDDDSEWVPIETRIAPFPFGDDYGRCGVVRDVSDRRERERKLERRVRQQEAVTELGRRALEARDLDALLAEAAERVADTLGNDYCKVLDLDPDAGELLLRQGVGWRDGVVGAATVSAVDDDSQAAHTLRTDDPVVVTDLETDARFSGPELLTSHGVRSGISTVIGPADNPWGILGTHDAEPAAFSDHDVNFVRSVANILASAIARHEDERELLRQRERLAALNGLNEVVQEITEAVIDRSTREEIEAAVCEHLAATESYRFAWIGEPDAASGTVDLRAEAGVEGYLDGVTISLDPDDERSQGPTGRALRTGEMQTTQDVDSDSRYEPWRDRAVEYGFRSAAAIPIVHEDTVYGVLNIYTGRRNAFEGRERAVIGRLGEFVGHAIAATERKRALMSDEVVELDFAIPDFLGAVGIETEMTGTVSVEHAVPVEDDEFLVYGTATPDATDDLRTAVEAVPHWESVALYQGDEQRRFAMRLTETPGLTAVASVGGSLEGAVVEDGDARLTVHVPPGGEVKRVIDAVTDAYPTARLRRHRQATRHEDDVERVHRGLRSALTERQHTALEVAYYAGFFEWPRDATGEEVAESLGVAPPTFHQHLRKAQRKVFDRVFSSTAPR